MTIYGAYSRPTSLSSMDGPYVEVPRDALEDMLALVDQVTGELIAQKLANPLTSALRGAAAEIRAHSLTSI